MSEEETVTLQLVEVHIDRGRDVITVDVPLHEVEVLKAVHGVSGAVRIADPDTGEIDLDISADAEIDRLQRKYRRTGAPDPVTIAFRGGARDLERHGFVFGRKAQEAPPQSGVYTRKPAKKAAKGK